MFCNLTFPSKLFREHFPDAVLDPFSRHMYLDRKYTQKCLQENNVENFIGKEIG